MSLQAGRRRNVQKCLIILVATPVIGYFYFQFVTSINSSQQSGLPGDNKTNKVEIHPSEPFRAKQKIIRVILLSAFARSGSTYLSRLLASSPNVSLWHEPLRYLYEKPPIDSIRLRNVADSSKNAYKQYVATSDKLDLIRKFMDCEMGSLYHIFASWVARAFVFKLPSPGLGTRRQLKFDEAENLLSSKADSECELSNLRIMKTIRLHVIDLLQEDFPSLDYQVIVLFRDPRAIIYSIFNSPDNWPPGTKNISNICSTISSNYEAVQADKHLLNVQVVKYENLIQDPANTLRKIFESWSLPNVAVNQYLDYALVKKNETSVKREVKNSKSSEIEWYYGVRRDTDFKHDHWREDISPELLKTIMSNPECEKAIRLLQYES